MTSNNMSSIQAQLSNTTSRKAIQPNNENQFIETQLNSLPLLPLRSPLITIPDPSQNPKEEIIQENDLLDFKANRFEANHRFGHRKIDTLNYKTPNRNGVRGKAHSESKSAHNTPSRSVSLVSATTNNGALGFCTGNRPIQEIGIRGGSSSKVLRRFSIAPSELSTQVPCFELVEDPSFWTDHNVQVLIRIRPINHMERALQGNVTCLKQENAHSLSWLGHPETRFTFDHIACEMISQEKLFKVAGLPMVDNCMSGYNSCMFAYGQTGSGKTYTMMGDIHEIDGKLNGDCGLTPRIFEYLFTRISMEEECQKDEKLRYSCKCSFLEIYNEQITDLLEPSSTNLQLREDLGKGVYVENLTEWEVTTVQDVIQLLLKGSANRKMAATNMNSESSRSHSVFTCIIESRREIDSVTHLRFGRLNLVDLAGSERQKSSGAEGERLKEAANINKSLSTLGLVIMTLVDVAHGKHRHVPYRDSRLTFLLQDSLGGNSKTTIIANISPSICCANETLSTLKFAQRAKLIQNNAKINEDTSGDVIALQRQIQQLKDQLTILLKHQNFSKAPTICSNFEQSQSGEVGDTSASTLKGKNSDHQNTMIFPKEKMGGIKATLVGALRREEMADTSVRRLEAELEHMNRLVLQREEDAQRTKMIVRFREEKIKRLELLSDGLVSADEYLMEENKALLEENQLLQARIDRNPELTRFALENIRLIEQLRMFQDFYEQGERETLLAEVSELRDQLMETLQGNYGQPKLANQKTDIASELVDCQRNLDECVEVNAKLIMEVDQLQRELNMYTECTRADPIADSSRDPGTNRQTEKHSPVEIISIKSESEDEIASYNKEDQFFHIKNNQKMDGTFAFQCKDLQKELLDAKYMIEAMECEQLLLIDEMNILQKKNLQYEELLGKKDPEDQLQETSDRGPQDTYLLTDGSADFTRSSLTSKLEGLNRDLEQARILNKRYLTDQESQNFHQNEFEQVCQQVEVETANTILLLQEELAKFQENIIFLSKENSRLRNIIRIKDDEFRMSSEKWEKALLELTSFLVDGCRSLEDASEHIGSIANSFPEQKALISDQVERAANCFLEKERTIVKLQNSLEDAQQLGQEMLSKLNSLKGATIAITEIQQLETDDSSREVIKLHTLLSEKMAKIEELERKFKNEEQILEAGKGNDTQGNSFNTCNHLGVDNQEELNQYAVQQMAPQLEPSELRQEKAEAGGSNGTEVQHAKLSDAIFFGEEKIKMASSFFSKFEEAQATIEDADTMLNALLTANENAKIMTSMWKQAAEDLMMEREDLIEEVQQFKSSLCLKEGEYESMQAQIHSSLAEIALSVTNLEESFLQMQSDVEKSFKVVYSDIFSLGQDLLGFICKSRSSMEDIWTEIMENGFASFVLYQCYAEKLSERISSLRLDSDAFHYKQKNCYSILKNVGKGFTSATGGKSVLKDTNNIEEGHTENLQNKVCGLGQIMALKTEEDEMGLDRDSLIFDNLSLRRELARKDVLLKGLLFDISLLQESTSSSMDVKDETEEMFATLTMVRNELGVKTTQLDEILLKQRELETKLVDCNAAICISNSKLKLANEAIEMLSNKNSDLIIEIENLKVKKNIVEDQLEEQKDVVKGLEEEILRLAFSIEEKDIPSIEDIEDDLRRVTTERDHLQEEVLSLNDRLEMAKALVDENEALAVEARQESEASKVYAEQKEEEATILEHSVEELERTINVLEKKVYDMGSEVERHYMRRNDLEVELEALRLRMLTVENSTENMDSQGSGLGLGNYQTSRLSVVRAQDLEEAKEQIRVLEKDRADMAREIKECREYISELVLHAEAQALQYQQKYKTLETMVREVKSDSSFVPPPLDIIEKSSMRTRGSSSPFRCIASLVQQMKIEKDQEMSVAKLKIEELQALVSSRQKEVCVLNARLAAAENMTHDVIRDLLGVKLDITNYANLIDQHQVQNLVEEAHQQTEKYFAKEQENLKLREKIDELTEEIQSCVEEINQKETDILAAQVRLEQLQQRDQMLLAQNEMLKMDKLTLKRKIAEMDELLKRNYRPLSVQQQIQQPNKNKENSFLRCSNEELTKNLTKSDKLLSRLNDELAWYTNSESSDPNNRKESGL